MSERVRPWNLNRRKLCQQVNQTNQIMSHTIKGLSESSVQHDGSSLRVAIVHARWNATVIDALLAGAVAKLKERGVKESNIIIQSVPGSFELPLACSKSISPVFGILGTISHYLVGSSRVRTSRLPRTSRIYSVDSTSAAEARAQGPRRPRAW